MDKIPVFAPVINAHTIDHVTEALNLGWLGMGSITKDFENELSKWLGITDRYVVATNTGTSALHLALLVAGVGPGDEVIVPSFDYIADHQAIRMTGASIVMCDIEEQTLGIDCVKAEELLSDRTKAIIPLHFAGLPCNIKQVYELANANSIRVIEDSMHAFGTVCDGMKLGASGDITCFSFDPVKIITSIDGGCVIVNTADEMERLRHLRFLGVDKETSERYKNSRSWEYDVIDEGYRYHLTNIMASIGLSQLKQVDKFIESRQKTCQIYNESFSDIENLLTPKTNFNQVSPFIYYVRIKNNLRNKFINHLKALNIDVGVHFIPAHKLSYFDNCKCGDMSVTNMIADEIVTLPLHSFMDENSVNRVIHAVKGFFDKQ